MPPAEIRSVPFDALLPWLKSLRTTFLDNPAFEFGDPQRSYWQQVWDPDRAWGAYDPATDRCVATLRTFPTTVTVPGTDGDTRLVAADALTQVTVAATHRRQGLLRAMLTRSLSDARDRGEAVSVLRAAEWPIYGRYGYAPTARATNYRVITQPRVSVLPPAETVTIRQYEPEDYLAHAIGVFDTARRARPGEIDRSPAYWQRRVGIAGMRAAGAREPVCLIAFDESDRAVGAASWVAGDGDFFEQPVGLTLSEFLSTTADGYRALWRYLLGIDLISSINWIEQAEDEPLEHLLTDGRAARHELTRDGMWLRILDVEAALSARRYAVADRLVLEVVDTDAEGWTTGRYTLDGSSVHAECTRTPGATPDLTLSQRALATAYLGGFPLRVPQLAGLVTEHNGGAVARLNAMLATDRRPANITPF